MAQKTHHSQAEDFKNLDFTLWALRREHAARHEDEVNKLLSESQHARH